ncbi:hypothetical protein F5B22DRAFT_610558 [Xylaria bambusicola]|uniref:uncharacterized protein n=1 Tax=Xylaria bambusicola TaxID=326684 RepID=UPI0020077E42|nr:uncharacterized protein F5B22DRAFT_610558 [Xylaria bambusicola]KAI0514745.1 hypothetical protein F5B22DRAFT_610558 [Xylaria bambusicola]
MGNLTVSMLNPQLFRPGSAELKRAKKREAQRKYRHHLRQHKKEKGSNNSRQLEKTRDDGTRSTSNDVNESPKTIVPQDLDINDKNEPIPRSPALKAENARQPRQQHPPLSDDNEQRDQQAISTSTAAQFVTPQPTHPLPASFEDMFSMTSLAIIEGGVAEPIDDQQLPVYHTALLDLPSTLDNRCDLFPTHHAMDSTTPRITPNTLWGNFEDTTEPTELGHIFQDSSQKIRQMSILHDPMIDENGSKTQGTQRQATSSLAYSPFTTATNNLPSPAPSQNGEGHQKRPSQATSTASDFSPSAHMPAIKPIAVNTAPELQGCTPLFQAVLLCNLKIVAILVARGCNINTLNGIGQTVLHVAAQNGHVEMVEYLITCGIDLDHQDNGGNTALHFAVINGYEGIVELLVSAGAKMDIMNN